MPQTRKSNIVPSSEGQVQIAKFVGAIKSDLLKGQSGVMLDSAATKEFVSEQINRSSSVLPEKVAVLLDELGSHTKEEKGEENQRFFVQSLLDGMADYETSHGIEAPIDLVEQAIHNAWSFSEGAGPKMMLDSATSDAHDPLSLHPNKPVIAVLGTFGEAVPFAHYLPADISSNEAKIAILSHMASSTTGSYQKDDTLDGIYQGDRFISSARIHAPANDGTGKFEGKVTAIQTAYDQCKQDAPAVAFLAGRAKVYINGLVAAYQASTNSGAGSMAISGMLRLGSTSYQVSGTFNHTNGIFKIDTSPALPTAYSLAVEAFLDYEKQSELTPMVSISAEVYNVFAKSFRCSTQLSIDSGTQIRNELGLDPMGEAMIALQGQHNMEKHYEALYKVAQIAKGFQGAYDFNWAVRQEQMNRAQIWQDFNAVVNLTSQNMAERTFGNGATHMYVGDALMSQFMSMSPDQFEFSGISNRPGIYRIGRFVQNGIEVYYLPESKRRLFLNQTDTSAQALLIGRGSSAARSPIVIGDAVAPRIVPIATTGNYNQNAGYYSRGFVEVNPHQLSAMSAAIINVTNYK